LAISSKLRDGVISCLQAEAENSRFFEDRERGVCFRNGFVKVVRNKLVLLPHDPSFKATYAHAFDFKRNASCKAWTKFLKDVFKGDTDAALKRNLLQDYIGAAMIGIVTRLETCLVLYGRMRNGKSVFIETVSKLFPPELVTAVPPQDWGQEYYRARLAGAWLNIMADIPAFEILNGSIFKAIVSGDLLSARHIHQPPFDFRPSAGHIFSANELPPTRDQTPAFWRRFTPVKFNRIFEGVHAKPKLDLLREIQGDLPGIVLWALQGAARVLAAGKLVQPPSSKTVLDSWRLEADQVAMFLVSRTTQNGGFTPCSEAYDNYKRWAFKVGHKKMSLTAFGKRAALLGFGSVKQRSGKAYPFSLKESEKVRE
jgi:P4 family phage/plasmid primase-like protien